MSFPYRILALGAGGVRGFLHVGALLELERHHGDLINVFTKGIYGSSVGSLIATGIAFGLSGEQIRIVCKQFLRANVFVPKLTDIEWITAFKHKGCIPMHSFEQIVLEGFQSQGIDLTNKTLQDAKIPLHVVTSNITKGTPAVFQKHVPVLTALKASCCLPGLFQPVSYRSQLYIDGDIFSPSILHVVPETERAHTMVINLRQPRKGITLERLEQMNPLEYVYNVYKLINSYHTLKYTHDGTLDIVYPNISGTTELTSEIEDDMIAMGKCMVHDFLQK